ncbi:MAG: iron ABC transporter permease [Ignavibacteria bacterium]|jgi:iron(III) transport system permease protein|nr:iron ABC transporter permease [Ignavibacteria bacterium]MBK9227104.1 iron ABC transporter permease [Ignavibacteria bacterium]
MQNKISVKSLILLLIPIFFAFGYIVYPLTTLFLQSAPAFTDSFGSLLSNSAQPIWNSIALSLITVAGSCVIGTVLAYMVYYYRFPMKKFISAILLVPIAAPPLVGVVSFLFLLGENGLLTKFIMAITGMQTVPFIFDGWTAVIVVHLYSFYPYFYLFASSALMKTDSNLIDASYSLGASKFRTVFKVIVPQLLPAIAGASLIVFMASMASFSAPFIYAGSSKFLTTEIYFAKINGDTAYSAALAVILTLMSLIFLLLLRAYRKKNAVSAKTKGSVRVETALSHEHSGFAGTLTLGVFSILILLPVAALVYLSLIPEGSLMRNFFAEPFTAENYTKVFNDPAFFEPFYNSIVMSVIAVALVLIVGVIASWLITKKKISGGGLLESILSIPYGVPGTVIAIAFILSFSLPSVFSFFTILAGTFWILPLAYAVRNVPLMTQSVMAGLSSIDPSLEEASSTLGASDSRTFAKITAPLVMPSVIHASMLVFIACVGEFVSTILLYTFSTKTISVEIYSQLRLYNTGAAAAYGVILFAVVMVVVFFSRRTIEKSS